MLLGFQRRFVEHILDGSKTHTIRGKRKRAPRVGEICHCYVDARQKTMRLLGRWPCVRVQDIRIEVDGGVVTDGGHLDADESDLLAYLDGFRLPGRSLADPGPAYELMFEFFQCRLPFHGDIIHWDFDQPVPVLYAPAKIPTR